MPSKYVVVSLTENISGRAPRTITLDEDNDSCLLGRASRKGAGIVAQPNNGYFENPVVSRNHAEIRADFTYERVYVKDIGSTHGTFVNNIRIPATVRHPIRTDDVITLGVEIKSQGAGAETVYPSMMTVGVKFGTRPGAGTNVFKVPDETSVEGSEPEDVIERARRFLLEHSNRPVYDTIDLTQDASHSSPDLEDGTGFPPPSQDKNGAVELTASSGLEAEDVEDSGEDYGEDDDEIYAEGFTEYYGEDDDDGQDYAEYEDEGQDDGEGDVEDEDDMDIEGEDHDTSSGPSCTCPTVGETTISGDRDEGSINIDDPAAPAVAQGSPTSMESDSGDDGDNPSQPGDRPPLLVESKDLATRGDLNHLSPKASRGHETTTVGDEATAFKKRKASEISRDDEPDVLENKDKKAPIVSALSASGVQTEPSDEREPKRLRRAADIVGYTALGGIAGALAVFTTLVLSAPSFP